MPNGSTKLHGWCAPPTTAKTLSARKSAYLNTARTAMFVPTPSGSNRRRWDRAKTATNVQLTATERAPRYCLREYALYISFFPQLIAGPIVRHDELIPQLALDPNRAGLSERFARGLVLLAIGLVKKLYLADALASAVDPVYAAAASGQAVGFADAWGATIAFALQIYFDFSSYSDMAIGCGKKLM